MTEDGKIREEISEVMSGDNLSDDMDLEKRSLVRRFAIPAILAMAASIALVLFLYFGKNIIIGCAGRGCGGIRG